MQFFLKSPRRKNIPDIDKYEIEKCNSYIKDNNITIVVHASYLLNISTKDDYEYKIKTAIQDIKISHAMGGIGAIFHVGKHLKMDKKLAISNMKSFIIDVISKLNDGEKFILETAAGCGTELCYKLDEFGDFINSFEDKYKKYISVCIDTCHVFSAGYDLTSKQNALDFIQTVENTIKWENVSIIHLNDSKKGCGSRVDRHENLCNGFIGNEDDSGFKILIQYFNAMNIPVVLETPDVDDIRVSELEMINRWIKN